MKTFTQSEKAELRKAINDRIKKSEEAAFGGRADPATVEEVITTLRRAAEKLGFHV